MNFLMFHMVISNIPILFWIFSGRGTPNVSGRDTPSSQVEGEEQQEREQRTLDLPITAQKQNREDISEKFGKFEIKTLIEGMRI